MRFQVGPHLYRVEVSPNPLFDDESRPLLGACDADRRRILICPTCPLQARLNVVLHELRHANIYATGMAPQDPESDADHYAASTENIIMDLERQGGLPALLAMGMDDAGRYDLTAARHTLAEVGNGMPLVSCSTCMQRIAHGSVVVTEPFVDPKIGARVVELSFYCPNCDHVQVWREFCTVSGRPTSAWAGKVRLLTGTDASEWCRRHPDQAMVFEAT